MPENITRKHTMGQPAGCQSKGRPKATRLERVEEDLRGVRSSDIAAATDRIEWQWIPEQGKSHTGLSRKYEDDGGWEICKKIH